MAFAGPFGFVQRHVGVAHQRLGVLSVGRGQGHADRAAGADLHAIQVEGPGHGVAQVPGLLQGVFRGHGARQDGHELVTGEATGRAVRAQAGGQALGHAAQQPVPLGVAIGVVDLLEVVEVDEEHRDRPHRRAGTRRRLQCGPQRVHRLHPVGQAGQRIVEGEAFDAAALFCLGAVAHPLVHQQDADDRQQIEPKIGPQGELPLGQRPSAGEEHIDGDREAAQCQRPAHLAQLGLLRAEGDTPGDEGPQDNAHHARRADDAAGQQVVLDEQGAQSRQQGHGAAAVHQPVQPAAPAHAEQHARRQHEPEVPQRTEHRKQRDLPGHQRRPQIEQPLPAERGLEADSDQQPGAHQLKAAVPRGEQSGHQHRRSGGQGDLPEEGGGLVALVGGGGPGPDEGGGYGQVLQPDQQAHGLARRQRHGKDRLHMAVPRRRQQRRPARQTVAEDRVRAVIAQYQQGDLLDAPRCDHDPARQWLVTAVADASGEPDRRAHPRAVAVFDRGGLPARAVQRFRARRHGGEGFAQGLHRVDQVDGSVRRCRRQVHGGSIECRHRCPCPCRTDGHQDQRAQQHWHQVPQPSEKIGHRGGERADGRFCVIRCLPDLPSEALAKNVTLSAPPRSC